MTKGKIARDVKDVKGIKSVEVGYRVLLAVQGGPGPVKLSEVAKRCGLTSGAAHNYITSLVRTGLVEQEDRGRYRLGPSAFALSLTSFRQLNGYDILRDIAKELNALTNQSTAVAVWSQGGPVSVFALRSEDVGSYEFRSGHLPLTDSGAGLVFIAYLHESHTRPLLELELGVEDGSQEEIDRVIADARTQTLPAGYALHVYEDPAPYALSAPVQMKDGRIPFVLTIVVHKAISPKLRASWAGELVAAAARAAESLADMDVGGPLAEFQSPFATDPTNRFGRSGAKRSSRS